MTAHHKLLLKRPNTGPGWLPVCSCGWQGIPRARRVAEAEYRAHRRHIEGRHVHDDELHPQPLTPDEDLPDELRGPHPDVEPFERAVDEVVARIEEADASR